MSQCEHKTAVTLSHATPHKPYTVLLCTWGCGEHLISVDRPNGITETWAASELIELAQAWQAVMEPYRGLHVL